MAALWKVSRSIRGLALRRLHPRFGLGIWQLLPSSLRTEFVEPLSELGGGHDPTMEADVGLGLSGVRRVVLGKLNTVTDGGLTI